jgi:acetolactate synthase-1/2/3 large subunit
VSLLRGSDIVSEYLEKERVQYVFGLCGHGNVGMLDSLMDHRAITTISVHHEAAAGFMADAYFRVTRRPAVTLTSCGPGSAQLPIALGAALMDASAFLAITGNIPTSQFNRGPFQETGYHYQADFPSVVRPYVKRSYQATRAEQLPLMLRQAFALMTTGKPGPVHLDIPLNVFVEPAEVEVPDPCTWNGGITRDVAASDDDVQRALDALLGAARPLILLGNGAVADGAHSEAMSLSSTLGVPIAWTPDGKGCVDPRLPLHIGETGRNGTSTANLAARHADVILAVGARFDDRASSSWIPGYTFNIPPTRLIQVEPEPRDLARNFPVSIGLIATPKVLLAQLLSRLRASGLPVAEIPARWSTWRHQLAMFRSRWEAQLERHKLSDASPLRPERLLFELRRTFPVDGIVLADVGVHHNWMVQAWPAYAPRTLLQSWGFASMGFGLAGALGAKLAAPDRAVLAVVGDGGFLMMPGVVATAVEYQIPVIWVVWNNRGYISIRDIQRSYFGSGREFCTDFRSTDGELYSPDFPAMARAMGALGFEVQRASELAETLETALGTAQPCVIDVPVDREAATIPTATWDLPPLPHPELAPVDPELDLGLEPRAAQGVPTREAHGDG